MGIRYLNKYLQKNCKNGSKEIHLNELKGKKITIDISIYLYRFIATNSFLENLYLMISLFKKYDIIPVFIFDGKPPEEKKETIWIRNQIKKNAENEYNELQNKIKSTNDEEVIKNMQDTMDTLKKKFIRINHRHIKLAKDLITSYGVSYLEAPNEADELCAKLVIKNKAYACLSEDMDMFVYGCPRVLRYFSLQNPKIILYDLKNILTSLNLNINEFREICVLSNNDYNTNSQNNLYSTIKYFDKYKKLNTYNSFIDFLTNETQYIENFEDFTNIYNIYDLSGSTHLNHFNKISISNGPIHHTNLKTLLLKENFIFP